MAKPYPYRARHSNHCKCRAESPPSANLRLLFPLDPQVRQNAIFQACARVSNSLFSQRLVKQGIKFPILRIHVYLPTMQLSSV